METQTLLRRLEKISDWLFIIADGTYASLDTPKAIARNAIQELTILKKDLDAKPTDPGQIG